MRRKLPPFPITTKSAVAQVRRGSRTVERTTFAFVSESELYTYYKLGKFSCRRGQLRRTALKRGKLRKHVERWLDRLDELSAFAISDELYRAIRRLAACVERIFHWCERIPRKDHWRGDPWCQRLSAVASEIRRMQ